MVVAPLLRRPLVGLVGTLLAGMTCGLLSEADPRPFLVLALVCWSVAAACVWRSSRPRWVTPALYMTVLTAAMAWGAHVRAGQRPVPVPVSPVPVTLTGRICDEPVPVEERDGTVAWRFHVEVAHVVARGFDWPVGRPIAMRWYAGRKGRPGPAVGERWRFKGRVHAWARYGRDPLPVVIGGARGGARLERASPWHLQSMIVSARGAAVACLGRGLEDWPRARGILQALLLGYRERVDPEVRRLFVRTGTQHILAISGLHVGIVAGFLVGALGILGVPRTRWVFYVAPLLTGYVVLAGGLPSAVRACIMAIAYLAATALNRRADGISALAVAALIIAVWLPDQVGSPGFVLSFAVVLGLLVVYPVLERRVRGLLAPDPLRVEPERWIIRMLRGTGRYLVCIAGLSIVCWVVSAPLVVGMFGRVAPVGLLANMLVVPLAFLMVLSGVLSMVLSLIWGWPAETYNLAGAALSELLVAGLGVLARVPGGFVRCEPGTWWPAIVVYGGLTVGLLWVYGTRQHVERFDVG